MLFLLAGFDTTATTLTNTIFLLARNQAIQEKLYDQIVEKSEKFVGFDKVFNQLKCDTVTLLEGKNQSRDDS